MKKKLDKLLKCSHSPYSGVKVSAILKTKDGKLFEGVNVENAAYPSSLCAERNAIFSAITKGHKAGDFSEIHLTSNTLDPLFPCGACRQVMSEFFENDTKIIVHNKAKKHSISFEELMPMRVIKESLKHD